MRRKLALLLAGALLAGGLSACQETPPEQETPETQQTPQTQQTESPAPAADQVVATVDGREIWYSQLAEQMLMTETMYRSMADQFTQEELEEKLHDAALSSLEQLISGELLQLKAEEYGLSLTEEDRAQAQESWEQVLEQLTDSVQASYPSLEGEDLDAMVELALEASGLDRETVVASAEQSALVAKLKAAVLEQTPQPTQEELRQAYQELSQTQREAFDADVTAFEAEMLAGDPVTYVPAEYRVIQELPLEFDSEVIQLLKQMEEYDTDESDSYEEILALEYQRILDEVLPGVLARLEEGEPFAQLVEEMEPGGGTKFNYISEETTRLSRELQQAALALSEEGAWSEPVQTERGYVLLYWADTLEAGERPLEAVEEQLAAQLLQQAQNRAWTESQAQWREEADVVIHEDRLGY